MGKKATAVAAAPQPPRIWEQSSSVAYFGEERVNAIRKQMSEKDVAHYEQLGESMFSSMQIHNNADGTVGVSMKITGQDPRDKFILAAVAWVRSGLDPEDFEEKDKAFCEEYWGSEWVVKIVAAANAVIMQ